MNGTTKQSNGSRRLAEFKDKIFYSVVSLLVTIIFIMGAFAWNVVDERITESTADRFTQAMVPKLQHFIRLL